MRVVRPARMADLPRVLELAKGTGGGMTTLPPDEAALAEKIQETEDSLAHDVTEPGSQTYLFVLDIDGEIAGTAGLIAAVGARKPFFNYRQLTLTQVSYDLDLRITARALALMNDFTGWTEIATLFVDRAHRGGGAGSLLARARYMFMGLHRNRFADHSMSEIRGWVDEAGRSPFWEAVGRHFFRMDLYEADRLSAVGDHQFISDLMPKFPIYVELLSKEAQAVIGKPHAASQAAFELLRKEGFRYEGAVDIFDAGPCLSAPTDDIRSIRHMRRAPYGGPPKDAAPCATTIVAAGVGTEFRAMRTDASFDDGHITFAAEAAEALGVAPGDPVAAAGG